MTTATQTNRLETVPRSSFGDRWANDDLLIPKTKIAPDKTVAAELDRWAAGKTPANREELLAAYRVQQADLATRLAAIKVHHARLIEERNMLFARRLLLGEQATVIAADAEVTPMVVNVSTGISKKNR